MRGGRLLLIAGDIAAFAAFGLIGLASHEESVSLEVVARSMAPFPVAWLLVAPWFGVFSAEAVAGRIPVYRLLMTWLVVGVVALVARSVIFDRELANAFFVIALAGNALFLTAWRAAHSAWLAGGRRATPAPR